MRDRAVPWPDHLKRVFAAIGAIMGAGRLRPELLLRLPTYGGEILEDHRVLASHTAGRTLGRRKGLYTIEIIGPRLGGWWRFHSGELERLASEAAKGEAAEVPRR